MSTPKDIKFQKSSRKHKKYHVSFTLNGKKHTLDFGDKRYEQYRDSTPLNLYSHLNHGNKKRRENYLSRSAGIRDSSGKLTKNNPLSPNYWSIRYLW